MTDLTMGQRIAECRKQLSLSQEALGEKMGVSRQAISKWEADGAVPEIDKLIALSKLFGVSVGWLLGVEESKQEETQPEVSEELLHKIEQIVRQYQPKKQPVSIGKRILIGAAAVLLCLAGWTFFREWDITRDEVGYVSGQVRNNNEQNADILNQLSILEERINNMSVLPEAAVSEAILSDYSFQMALSPDKATAEISISAIPAKWSEGITAAVSVRRDGSQLVSQTCAWDGSAWTARLQLNVEDGYEYWFVLSHPDGTLEQTCLQNSQAEDIAASFTMAVRVTEGQANFDKLENAMFLENYTIRLAPPTSALNNSVTLGPCDLVLYHIRGSERQVADTYNLWGEQKGSSNEPVETVSGVECYPNGPFQLPEMEDGDGLELWLKASLTNGVEESRLLGSWAYVNGEFIGSEPEK